MALPPRKMHAPATATVEGRTLRFRTLRPTADRRVEFHGATLRSHPFTSKRFHVLLNSLFKVLFNFHGTCPLAVSCQYLALDGVYHPLWAAFPNNPTPRTLREAETSASRGLTPAMGKAPIRRTRAPDPTPKAVLNTTVPTTQKAGDSVLGSSRFTRRY